MRHGLPSITAYNKLHTRRKMFPDRNFHYMDSVSICWAAVSVSAAPTGHITADSSPVKAPPPPMEPRSEPRPAHVCAVIRRPTNEPDEATETATYRRKRSLPAISVGLGQVSGCAPLRTANGTTLAEEEPKGPQKRDKSFSGPAPHPRKERSVNNIRVLVKRAEEEEEQGPKKSDLRRKSALKSGDEDEWELIMRHRARVAAAERARELLALKARRRQYREALEQQIEGKKASSDSANYEKQKMRERVRRQGQEFARLERERRLQGRRIQELNRRSYDDQVRERREAIYRTGRNVAKCENGIIQTMTEGERLYKKVSEG